MDKNLVSTPEDSEGMFVTPSILGGSGDGNLDSPTINGVYS